METLYSNELRTYLRSRDWPIKLAWRVVEYPEEGYLQFVLYRDNLNKLDAADKLQVAKVINESFTNIRNRGIPIYTQVAKGSGLDES